MVNFLVIAAVLGGVGYLAYLGIQRTMREDSGKSRSQRRSRR
ncbi:MAG: hypothetical protein AAF206_16010 [Bacteroidota bacterium]